MTLTYKNQKVEILEALPKERYEVKKISAVGEQNVIDGKKVYMYTIYNITALDGSKSLAATCLAIGKVK